MAIWLGSPNYIQGREGHDLTIAPSYVILHTMVGTWESANARFQNPAEEVSAHYGVGYDGTIYQWVHEEDDAWHAGIYEVNLDSIGIEHEDMGNYNDPRPDALYTASANLVRDICNRYGIPITKGDAINGVSGIVRHGEDGYATACPDALDTDRIIREAANPPQPISPSTPSPEDNMGAQFIVTPPPAAVPALGDIQHVAHVDVAGELWVTWQSTHPLGWHPQHLASGLLSLSPVDLFYDPQAAQLHVVAQVPDGHPVHGWLDLTLDPNRATWGVEHPGW